MFFTQKHTIKLELSPSMTVRLKYYAAQANITEVEAIERVLHRGLPDLTRGLIKAINALTHEEQERFRTSYYMVQYLVSYADENISMKEKISIENGFKQLESFFGKDLTDHLQVSLDEQKTIIGRIEKFSVEDKIMELRRLQDVLEKLPEHLVEEYKIALLDCGFDVASASREGVFGEKISGVEVNMLSTIAYLLVVNIERHAGFFSNEWLDLQRVSVWKSKHRK